ncbi:hypothetical protein fugu_000925 [Takifugu bimaculatus]|uniref:Uncharacterized protein n=1 Tax=Takifugu bimaculatus TaxID=433685 RepID=A0A4Z2CI32_9TELE|nr:hypothetical protein fugu_000925 [Takifugu bimaculatus]
MELALSLSFSLSPSMTKVTAVVDYHKEVKELGGLKNIRVELPDWPVSDDTVLHLATAEGLATGKTGEELLHEVAARYIEGMKDMDGRAPGNSTIWGVSQLKPGEEGGYRVPYNVRGGGCGAAMRSMCIGLSECEKTKTKKGSKVQNRQLRPEEPVLLFYRSPPVVPIPFRNSSLVTLRLSMAKFCPPSTILLSLEVKELGGLKNIRVELPDWPVSDVREVKELGGLKNIRVELPDWPVSDDTVLHLATAEGLATGKTGEELLHEVAARYVEGMKDMDGRAPGNSTIWGVSQLKPGEEGGYRVPYNVRGGGCGAAMRSMCIGLRYPKPDQLLSLVAVAVETGRMTHPHPTGFLGAVASALFTAYAVQRRPVTTWGLGLIKEALPVAQNFVQVRVRRQKQARIKGSKQATEVVPIPFRNSNLVTLRLSMAKFCPPSTSLLSLEVKELGGLRNISVELPHWPVSDDTVLHLATAEGLATGETGEELLHEVAARYVEGMKDMDGRAPGPSSIWGVSQLKPGEEGGFRVPYNDQGTGCGAAMRSMCIGLR